MEYLKFIGECTTFNSTKWGKLLVESQSFTPAADGDLVIYVGDNIDLNNPIIRIHSECVFSEVFGSDFCDCANQLDLAMDYMKKNGGGILFYLRFDGRGAGLSAKVKATQLEMTGIDTFESRKMIGVEPEGRSFAKVAEYLLKKNIKSVIMLTNNPNKINDIESCGIKVTTKSLLVDNCNDNVKMLYKTKAEKFNHKINEDFYD